VSWSLLIAHTTPAIALQLMQGSYSGQHRPWHQRKIQNFISYVSGFYFLETLTIWFGKRNPDQGYYWNFCRARENAAGWEK